MYAIVIIGAKINYSAATPIDRVHTQRVMLSFSGTSNRPRYGTRTDQVSESRREAIAPQGSTRRSLFPQHDVTLAGPRGGGITNFYGGPRRDSTVTESRTRPWQPGETLPVHTSAPSRQSLSRAFNDFLDDDDDGVADDQHRQLPPTREHALPHN